MAVASLNDTNFNETISASAVPVLVDFYANWCQPCKRIAPLLEEIAQENPDKLQVYKVDVDESPGLASAYNVLSIPYVISFKNGEPYKRVVGAVPKAELLALTN